MKTLKLYNVAVSLKNLKMQLPVAAVNKAAAKKQTREYYPGASIGKAEQVGVVNVPLS
jgi:hypothetical protein